MDSNSSIDILTGANGVGPKTIPNFKEAGFETAEEVGNCTPEELDEKVSGVGYSTAISVLKHLEKNDLRDTSQRNKEQEQLVSLLRDLFEFDAQDRDFGMYKLMNANREEINQFIEEDLVRTIEEEIASIKDQFIQESNVEDVREEIISKLGSDAFDGDSLSTEAQQEINKRTQSKSRQELKNIESDIYNHIYQFFSNYYDSGDFISRRKRSHHEEPYSVPYDGSNTHFHWVTKDQYYSKTSENFTRFSFTHKNTKVKFVTENAELDESGVGNSEYFVMEDLSNREFESDQVEITFYRRMIGNDDLEEFDMTSQSRNKQETMNEIFAEKLEKELPVPKDQLETKLNEYTTRNQNDFFIHKNIDKFLESELEEYIKSEIVSFDPKSGFDGLTEVSMEKARVVNEITTDIISFVSQIEEFKRKIFEKNKFVKDSKSLVQVKNIPEEHYTKILSSESQLSEWEEFYNINTSELTEGSLKEYPSNQMMVDTSHFTKEIRTSEEPDNKLIKGDNYQALNFLQEKYQNSVKCIYIDPPYNTGNANFAYKDKYQRPTWLSMMYDRIKLGKKLLQEDGVIFASIDYREVENLTKIFNKIFGKENKVTSFIWKKRSGSNNLVDMVSTDHEYVLCYKKTSGNKVFKGEEKDFTSYSNPDDDPRGVWRSDNMKSPSTTRSERPESYYPIEQPETGKTYYPDGETTWRYSKEKMETLVEEDRISWPENPDGTPRLKRFKSEVDDHKPISSLIPDETEVDKEKDDIIYTNMNSTATFNQKAIFGNKVYDFPKPVSLIKTLINQVTEDNDIVLDFFAGSGTTAQSVTELNREHNENINYLLVEMLDEAFDITEERVKRTAYTREWKDGKPQLEEVNESEKQLELDVEVLELESYEESLDAIEFDKNQETLGSFNDTLIHYLLEFGTKDSPVFLDTDQLDKPLEYSLDLDMESKQVDVMTTFNYLIGLQEISESKVTINGNQYTIYKDPVTSTKVIWRHDSREISDYETEAEELNTKDYDTVYINGDSLIDNAKQITTKFKTAMMDTSGDNL